MRNAIIILLILIACFAEAGSKKQSMRKYSVFAKAGGTSTPVPTNGLVAYWSMRSSGATVYDEYGTNTGTAVNSPTFDSSYGVKANGIRLLSSQTQHVSTASTLIGGLSNVTFAFWIKPISAVANMTILSEFNPTGNNRQMWIRYFDSGGIKLQANAYADGGSVNVTSGLIAVPDTNAFTHCAIVFNSGSWTAYTNGAVASMPNSSTGTGASSFYDGTAKFYLGNTEALSGNISAYMDEVAVWNRALTSNEVYQIYSTPLYYP